MRPGTIDVVLAWSGGKDSTLALAALRGDPRYRVLALLTTVTRDYDRIRGGDAAGQREVMSRVGARYGPNLCVAPSAGSALRRTGSQT